MVTNDFVPFATGVGANVEAQATYITDPQTALGQMPGVARSAINNKALRQATSMAAAFAQYLVNTTAINAVDDGNQANLIALIAAGFSATKMAPTIQNLTGSGTYTVPTNPAPLYIRVKSKGAGGGGGGNNGGSNGTVGGDTTFGPTTAHGGAGGGQGGTPGGLGGAANLGSGPVGRAIPGTPGGTACNVTFSGGASGGGQGGGPGCAYTGNGTNAQTSSGGGGGGAGGTAGNSEGGSGGGEGGQIDAIITTPALTYSFSVGAGGAAGSSSSTSSGAGADGNLTIEEFYN